MSTPGARARCATTGPDIDPHVLVDQQHVARATERRQREQVPLDLEARRWS